MIERQSETLDKFFLWKTREINWFHHERKRKHFVKYERH